MSQAATPIRILKHYKVARAGKSFDEIDGLWIGNTQEEAEAVLNKWKYAVEWLMDGDIVCPFFDFETYLSKSTKKKALTNYKEEFELLVKDRLETCVKAIHFRETGVFDIPVQVAIGYRKPRNVIHDKHKVIKISVRAICLSHKINYKLFGEYLKMDKTLFIVTESDVSNYDFECLKVGDKYELDLNVYDNGKCINCFGSKKNKDTPYPIQWDKEEFPNTPLIMCPLPNATLLNIEKVMNMMKPDEPPKDIKQNIVTETSLHDAVILLNMLNVKRYKYNDWVKTGMIMWHTFGDANDDAFNAWADWSAKAPNVGSGYRECCVKWASYVNHDNPLTIGTLHLWAKEDNVSEYDKFMNSKVEWVEEQDETDKEDDDCDIQITYQPHIEKEADYYKSDYKYYVLKQLFEQRNFKVNNPVAYVELFDTELIIRSNAVERYRTFRYTEEQKEEDINGNIMLKTKTCAFYDNWRNDIHMRTYHSIDFVPPSKTYTCPPDVYNLWKGYDAEKYTTKRDMTAQVNKVLDFIKKVICCDKQDVYDYVMKWIANILQNPADKSKIALCLIGNQGDGKSYFTELITNIIGKCMSYTTQNAQEYFDRFDGTARLNKMLCVFNEINFEQMGKNADVLKGYITDLSIRHEKKGIDPIDVALYANYIFTTNNKNPLKIEDGDRRFVVLEVSSCYNSPDHNAYWSEMQQLKTNKHFIRRLYEHFMTIEIPDKYDWKANRPITEAYLAIRKRNLSPLYMFLSYVSCSDVQVYEWTPTEFTTRLNCFLSNNNFNSKMAYNPVWVSRELTSICDKLKHGISKQTKHSKKNVISINCEALKKTLKDMKYYFDEFET
jgi:hypothetical protein